MLDRQARVRPAGRDGARRLPCEAAVLACGVCLQRVRVAASHHSALGRRRVVGPRDDTPPIQARWNVASPWTNSEERVEVDVDGREVRVLTGRTPRDGLTVTVTLMFTS